jgi:hypothetical protein
MAFAPDGPLAADRSPLVITPPCYQAALVITSGCRAHPDVELFPNAVAWPRPARQIGCARRFRSHSFTEAVECGNSGAANQW